MGMISCPYLCTILGSVSSGHYSLAVLTLRTVSNTVTLHVLPKQGTSLTLPIHGFGWLKIDTKQQYKGHCSDKTCYPTVCNKECELSAT